MADYSNIRYALDMFSIQLGLDYDAARDMLRRSLKVPSMRDSIEAELRALVADPEAPWEDLVANDAYEIDDPETPAEAREIVLDAIWEVIFPGQAIPAFVEPLDSSSIPSSEDP